MTSLKWHRSARQLNLYGCSMCSISRDFIKSRDSRSRMAFETSLKFSKLSFLELFCFEIHSYSNSLEGCRKVKVEKWSFPKSEPFNQLM